MRSKTNRPFVKISKSANKQVSDKFLFSLLHRKFGHTPLILLVTSLILLIGCSSSNLPEPALQQPVEQSAAVQTREATNTPTSVATVPLPTAAPTSTPSPPTPTATLTTKETNTPSPPPTPLPTSTPESKERLYVVQELDTLLDIAIQFDTTVEAITTANGIEEGDFLQLGQKLVIPAPGQPAANINAPAEDEPQTESPETDSEVPTATAEAESDSDTDSAPAPAQPEPANDSAAPATSSGGLSGLTLPVPKISHGANINPLTGLPVDDPAKLQQRPLMVRIGNDTGARTAQVGLNRADMVYEDITEWWVTRFSAIFLSNIPETVGPIRSARLINVLLGPQYQAAVAHSGGSDPVRWEMTQIPIVNLDQWFHGSLFFHRPNEGWMTRAAFKATEAHPYLDANGLNANVKLRGFNFGNIPAGGEAAPNIFIPYPRATTFTQWAYDAGSGKYLRFAKDAPLVDAIDGTQVAASNVVVYFAPHDETDIVEDSNGGTSIRIQINGRGSAWFFRDGQLFKGTWQSDGTNTPYFAATDGTPFPLKPGNTWVQVVPTYFKIGLNSPDEASSRP